MKQQTIIITGGHHNSALVVAQALIAKKFKIIWIGHKYTSHRDSNVSAEYTEVTASNIPFHNMKAGKLDSQRKLINLLKLPLGLIQANQILKHEKPIAVISFGSYLGATVSFAAFLAKVPVYIHEQTVVAGKANLFSAKFARRIYLTWPSSNKHYPASKTLLTGLPLRKSITSPKKSKLFPNQLPTILVLGGKQGSHIINQTIFADLTNLLSKYNIIHQTGTSSHTGDYEKGISLQESLPDNLAARYHPRGYISESEIGHIIASSDIIVSRSGAHITYELAILGSHAVLIPYLHTHKREQLKNAHVLESLGQATILVESKLTPASLLAHIAKAHKLKTNQSINIPRNATSALVEDFLKDQQYL